MEYTLVNTSDIPGSHRPWRTGVWRRMPWLSVLCILGALTGLAASIAVVTLADGVPIRDWRYAPTVYLSISYTITNILIVAAFSGGVTISWWRKAMEHQTELGDLHRYWAFGTNPLGALKAGRKFNYIAFACLLVAVTPINGPLLQRSSAVVLDSSEAPVTLHMNAAPSLQGDTSYLGGDYEVYPTLINERFRPVVQSFFDSEDISVSNTGCKGDGICKGKLRAAGFTVNCSSYSRQFELISDYGKRISCAGEQVFMASFAHPPRAEDYLGMRADPGSGIIMEAEYKYSSPSDHSTVEPCEGCMETERVDCKGSVMGRICQFRAATVQYPVIINGNRSTIALDPGSTIWDDVVEDITTYAETNPSWPAGGIYLALQSRYGGNASLVCSTSSIQWDSSAGTTAQQFAKTTGVADSDDFSYCEITFDDPTEYLLSQARELTFRTAIAFGNESTPQTITGTQTRTTSFYRSNYGFLTAAVLLTMVSILVVMTTFNGFWTLGRAVSMSPLEIAKAFNAPLLAKEDPNAKAEELVRSSGKRNVRYQQAFKGPVDTAAGVNGFDATFERRRPMLEVVEV